MDNERLQRIQTITNKAHKGEELADKAMREALEYLELHLNGDPDYREMTLDKHAYEVGVAAVLVERIMPICDDFYTRFSKRRRLGKASAKTLQHFLLARVLANVVKDLEEVKRG